MLEGINLNPIKLYNKLSTPTKSAIATVLALVCLAGFAGAGMSASWDPSFASHLSLSNPDLFKLGLSVGSVAAAVLLTGTGHKLYNHGLPSKLFPRRIQGNQIVDLNQGKLENEKFHAQGEKDVLRSSRSFENTSWSFQENSRDSSSSDSSRSNSSRSRESVAWERYCAEARKYLTEKGITDCSTQNNILRCLQQGIFSRPTEDIFTQYPSLQILPTDPRPEKKTHLPELSYSFTVKDCIASLHLTSTFFLARKLTEEEQEKTISDIPFEVIGQITLHVSIPNHQTGEMLYWVE